MNSVSNYILVESFIFIEEVSPIFMVVSALIEEVVSGIAGATVVDVVSVIVESVVVVSPEPEPQAAKAPIAKTNKTFFIVVNVLCVSEFDS